MSLDRLLGTWDVSMRHVAVPEPVAGRQSCERTLDGAFVLQRASYAHPDFPDAIALYDDHSCHYFDVRGVARVFDLTVDASAWSIIRRDEDFWQRSTVTFVGDDAMEGHGENSFDHGTTWQHDFSITYMRVG